MPTIRFSRTFRSAYLGDVTAGDECDVTDEQLARYVHAGWGEEVAKPKPRKSAKASPGSVKARAKTMGQTDGDAG